MIGENVTIYPNNTIKGNTVIEDNVILGPNNYIVDSKIKNGSKIEFSYIEESIIGQQCQVGPYSRIRPNSTVGEHCKIGNFVEIKNSTLGNHTKASHLAYVGDCDIGANCNIGCGAIFVNYNGKEKNRSKVGNNCFIGSNSNIIAPVNIADDSYICAGTTLTVDTLPQDFVIARCRETIKHNYANKYKKGEQTMSVYFGTDGIRGIVNDGLTFDLAYKCGNAIGSSVADANIIVGGDTRKTRTFLTSALAGGAMSAGAKVIDIGVCPTAGIAYIAKNTNANFGVVVSASHNPAEYNGIKVFNGNGIKLNERAESELEKKFINPVNKEWKELGNYTQDFDLVKTYENYLVDCCKSHLEGLKIVLDCSNGASSNVAPNVFKRLGAEVVESHCDLDGNINDNCGSLHPQVLAGLVKKNKADIGFAFDGDADRVIACDEKGDIVDGDVIIYVLGNYLKSQGKLSNNTVVGTRHTNMGIEKALKDNGIDLIRTDIGDKYVIAKIEEQNLSLGGEKSGHIIFRELSTTGDGILTALKVAELVKLKGKKLSQISNVQLYPQVNIDCVVRDKSRIINSQILKDEINRQEKFLGDNSRIIARLSGTEPKIRIMCEGENSKKCEIAGTSIEKTIKEIDELQY